MAQTLRFAVLGTGNIARQFVEGLRGARRSRLAAVGSRQRESAEALVAHAGMPAATGSYEDVVRRSDVDAVYVALPNSLHREWTVAALDAGKHVLCEKPLASNLPEAQAMFDAAKRVGRLLVEAFMYRTHPLLLRMHAEVRGGVVGPLRLIRTSFCYRTRRMAGNIRFDAGLAGGALMDIGCYCVSFSRWLAGSEPLAVHGVGRLHESGVDEAAAGTLVFPGGVMAVFSCGMTLQADNAAMVCGEEGYVTIPVPWKPAERGATYVVSQAAPPRQDAGGKAPAAPSPRVCAVDAGQPLYGLEADAFAAAVLDGAAPAVSPADSLGNMRVLDDLRRQIGVPV